MGILRGFGIIIISILLFLSLLFAGITASISLSLNYDNVQPKTYSIASEIIKTQIGEKSMVDQLTPYLKVFCKTNTEVVKSFKGYTFVYPCSVVQEGYDSIINYSVYYLVNDFYYKEYNCSFIKCFEESEVPLFLVSNYARQFWKSLFFKALIASLILSCAIFLISEKRSNAPVLIGSLVIVNSFIVLTLEKIGTFIARAVLSPIYLALSEENTNVIISQIVAIFFSDSTKVFLWMFIAGLILIAIGIVFKITRLGFKIGEKIEEIKEKMSNDENVSKSEVREIIKEEILKKNKSKKKN